MWDPNCVIFVSVDVLKLSLCQFQFQSYEISRHFKCQYGRHAHSIARCLLARRDVQLYRLDTFMTRACSDQWWRRTASDLSLIPHHKGWDTIFTDTKITNYVFVMATKWSHFASLWWGMVLHICNKVVSTAFHRFFVLLWIDQYNFSTNLFLLLPQSEVIPMLLTRFYVVYLAVSDFGSPLLTC